MFNRAAYENSRPDGFGVLEVAAEGRGEKEPSRRFVPLKRTDLTGEIAGPLASLCLTQRFGYLREQCDRTLEALYRFPLPGDAAVMGVTVRFGEVEIRASLKERGTAEAEYEEAKRVGRQAALATRESPDVFTLRITGLEPDQEIVVETSYVQLARVEGSNWSLRLPLTTPPRYVREEEAGSRYAAGQPLALLRDPGHRFALNLMLRGTGAVASLTHRLEVTPGDGGLRVRLQDGEIVPDRDCVLSWQSPQEMNRPALRVMLHYTGASDPVYFLALAAPPAVPPAAARVPREFVLLVDHSGSMSGAKWAAADWAVKRFLSDLAPGDRFAMGLFHNTTRWFTAGEATLHAAEPETIAAGIRFLEENRDSGGTELGDALKQALALPRGLAADGERARHLLIVTDAQLTDASRLLALADTEAQRSDARRISLLCIDAAPNSLLATELAERGGGVARFLTSAPEEEDITTALDDLLADWAAPVLAGVRLEVDRPGLETSGRQPLPPPRPGWSGLDLGDLPAGRAIWAVGRVPGGERSEITFRLLHADGSEVAARRPRPDAARPLPALKALFGARRLLGLECLVAELQRRPALQRAGRGARLSTSELGELRTKLARLGYDADALLPETPPAPSTDGEPDWAREAARETLRKLLVREALDYGLACSETAFVAQRSEAGRLVEGTAVVANALPSGWSEEFEVMLAAPSTAFIGRIATLSQAASPTAYGLAGDVTAGGMTLSTAPMPVAAAMPAGVGVPVGGGARSRRTAAPTQPLFSGVPLLSGSEAVLFDSARPEDAARLPGAATFSELRIRFLDPEPAGLDRDLALLLFVEDLAAPRARVRLADLLRQGGSRPLNLRRAAGKVVRLIL